jgi:hypothetical protein
MLSSTLTYSLNDDDDVAVLISHFLAYFNFNDQYFKYYAKYVYDYAHYHDDDVNANYEYEYVFYHDYVHDRKYVHVLASFSSFFYFIFNFNY